MKLAAFNAEILPALVGAPFRHVMLIEAPAIGRLSRGGTPARSGIGPCCHLGRHRYLTGAAIKLLASLLQIAIGIANPCLGLPQKTLSLR